ncbi:MAG: hypothetical protein ACK559_12220 [bacterium]
MPAATPPAIRAEAMADKEPPPASWAAYHDLAGRATWATRRATRSPGTTPIDARS